MSKKVEFNEENFHHCRCPICPVQWGVDCAREKLEKYHQYEDASKNPEDGAKIYCSIGQSKCPDLKSGRPCLCPSCFVWYENKLSKMHYCTRGDANEIG